MVTEEKVEEAPEDKNEVTPEPKEATEQKQDEVQESEEVEEKSAEAEKDSLIATVPTGFHHGGSFQFRKNSSEKTVSVPVPIVPGQNFRL